MNKTLLSKVGWDLMQPQKILWKEVFKDKYLKGGHIMEHKPKKRRFTNMERGN